MALRDGVNPRTVNGAGGVRDPFARLLLSAEREPGFPHIETVQVVSALTEMRSGLLTTLVGQLKGITNLNAIALGMDDSAYAKWQESLARQFSGRNSPHFELNVTRLQPEDQRSLEVLTATSRLIIARNPTIFNAQQETKAWLRSLDPWHRTDYTGRTTGLDLSLAHVATGLQLGQAIFASLRTPFEAGALISAFKSEGLPAKNITLFDHTAAQPFLGNSLQANDRWGLMYAPVNN